MTLISQWLKVIQQYNIIAWEINKERKQKKKKKNYSTFVL